ncbi:MAG: beta-1,6-N-acetylglucosaminyltransferase [Lachnospiraceae bacterium]
MQAVLILAHKDAEQVLKLSKILSSHFLVYIHFDKKYHLPVELKNELTSIKGVYVYSEITVNWGSFSIGEAAFLLMREALKNENVSYIHLISGQDWPTKNIKQIYDFYENNDKIYLTYGLAEEEVKSGEPVIYWQKFYFDYDKINRKSLFGKVYHRISIKLQSFLKVDKFRDLGITLPIYQGANWCDLPRDAAIYCIKYLDENENFHKMLSTGFCTDEVVVQTILCNSLYKNRIENCHHRYMKWEKRYNSYPAILDMSDYEDIKKGNYHFARKIDGSISEMLIDKLEII